MSAKRVAKQESTKTNRDLSKKKVTLKDLRAIQGGDEPTKVDKYPKPAPPPPAPAPGGIRSWFGF